MKILFKYVILMIFVVFVYGNNMLNSEEVILKIEGQREGEFYEIDVYIKYKDLVICYVPPKNTLKKVFRTTFKNNELLLLRDIVLRIKKEKTFHTSIVLKSYNTTRFLIQTKDNTINAYIDNEIDTLSVQNLISFIIQKSEGKLNFLHNYDYFKNIVLPKETVK